MRSTSEKRVNMSLSILRSRPSDPVLGLLTISALVVLSVFGIWIQAVESLVKVTGFDVLSVEFAFTAEKMDEIVAAFIAAGVLHLELFVDILDVCMMPGWVFLFFGIHLLGLRALDFLGIHGALSKKSFAMLVFPLVAGCLDTMENLLIAHVLLAPATYARFVPAIIITVSIVKFGLLFPSMAVGAITVLLAWARVIRIGGIPEEGVKTV